MEYTYQELYVWGTTTIDTSCIKRVETQSIIPNNPDNTDYQKYLEWLAEGNTPEPADQGE
jgi:hypothetical protein